MRMLAFAAAGKAPHSLEFMLKPVEFLVAEIFEIHESVAGAGNSAEKFVEFQVKRFGIAVLSVLNDENHQKGDDRRARVDDELPGVREVENRAEYCPDNDAGQGEQEGARCADGEGKPLRANAKAVAEAEAAFRVCLQSL